MSTAWIEVPQDVADRHPLRSVAGWLILFGFWLVLPCIGVPGFSSSAWNAPLNHPGAPAWAPAAWNAALILADSLRVILLILYLRRTPNFRLLFVPLALLATAVDTIPDLMLPRETAFPTDEAWPAYRIEMVVAALGTVAVDVAFAVAAWRGRRFRLVFERRVRPDDPILSPAPPAGLPADAR